MFLVFRSHVMLFLIAPFVVAAWGEAGANDSAADSAAAQTGQEKTEALAWLDGYRKVQVLFNNKDLERLREEIAASTPDEAKQWLEETKEIRAALDSPEWKTTREWLREFLRVQAIYTDEQIAQFRKEAKEAAEKSPEKFQTLLADVEEKRASLARGAANDRQLRQQMLDISRAYRQDQFAQREAVRRQAAQFGSGAASSHSAPVPRKTRVGPPPPLVDSLDVARWSVMQNFWRRW
jgi:hypothetical protein